MTSSGTVSLVPSAQTTTPPTPFYHIHSCEFCQVQEIDSNLRQKRTTDSVDTITISVRYRGTRIIHGALNGCDFFKHCLGVLEPILKSNGYEQGSDCSDFKPINWVYIIWFMIDPREQILKNGHGYWSYVEGELPKRADTPGPSYLVLAFPADNPAADKVLHRPFVRSLQQRECVAWAEERLIECDCLHVACRAPQPPYFPTRLLHVQGPSSGRGLVVRLILVTSSTIQAMRMPVVRYATLSYCWGGQQVLNLNADTEASLLHGLPTDELPKTLSDAAVVTWRLQIPFLWIDSLCIRQDDPSDQAREISRMHLVYSHSYLTISATRASDCRQGFLHECTLPFRGTTAYKLPFASPAGKLGAVLLSEFPRTAPVDARSWTLQEHMLARRVIRFTNLKQYWSCNTTSDVELRSEEHMPVRYSQDLDAAHNLARSIREDHDEAYKCNAWMNIVEEYTKRGLTHRSDKLLAISAIAETWNSRSGDTYLAGVWKSHLPKTLLWMCRSSELQTISETYIAPSWSWASVLGEVECSFINSMWPDPQLDILDCKTVPVHEDAPYGAVESGAIILSGLLVSTLLEEVSNSSTVTEEELGHLDLKLAHTFLDFCDPVLVDKTQDAQLFCLQLLVFEEGGLVGPSGLILVSKDFENFHRIGCFSYCEEDEDIKDESWVPDDAFYQKQRDRQAIQRNAFQGAKPRIITLL